jgi:hypothetical protein
MRPNLLVIGAQKCGTTTLHNYLNCHPEIFMSKYKELVFFIESRAWSKGLDWYEAQFPVAAKVRGESSQGYTNYPQFAGVPARIKQVVPDAKFIYMVRDPIERVVSQYLQRVGGFREFRPFDQALRAKSGQGYLANSKYYMQLEQYLEHFPADRFLIVSLESLIASKRDVLRRVFQFLEVDEGFYDEQAFSSVLNRSDLKLQPNRLARFLLHPRVRRHVHHRLAKLVKRSMGTPLERPVVTGELQQLMVDALSADVAKFRQFTGQSFSEWKNIHLFDAGPHECRGRVT